MITLKNVNKYFNRHKSNQIHVINNTSLDLPENGIVTLLGPSGCGKTTLLNAVGGLDKIGKGSIIVDGEKIAKRRSGKVDTIRNAKIGYIFQNFNLIDDRTVFDNVAITLRMVGVRNRQVIEDRVNYCLETVGIYAYRNRLAGALSGGQRQRVAIARAIVKNPKIIIADEPTGNLDSANTLEIMNLIKKMSKDRLVLLVTHEEDIAKFYSSRIIRLRDGKVISDEINEHDDTLDYQLENKIYLKDLPIGNRIRVGETNLDMYSDSNRAADIKLVLRGNNVFIDTGGKFTVIDENSDIELIDDHYSAIDQSIFEKSNFDYEKYLPGKFKPRYRSEYNIINNIFKGFKTVAGFKTLKKLLLIGFIISALFSFYAVSHMMGLIRIDDKDFMKTDRHYVSVANPGKSNKMVKTLSAIEGVDYVIPGDSTITFSMPMKDYYQTSQLEGPLSGSLVKLEKITEEDIARGRMPEKGREVVVDKMILKKFIDNKMGSAIGINRYSQFLDRTLNISGIPSYTIVGISDTGSPSFYIDEKQFPRILQFAPVGTDMTQENLGVTDYVDEEFVDEEEDVTVKELALAPKSLKVVKGKKPKKTYEVIVSNEFKDDEDYKIGKELRKKMGGKRLKIVGYYTTNRKENLEYFVTTRTIELDNISKRKKLSVYSEDPAMVVETLKAEGISSKENYTRDKKAYMESQRGSLRTSMILSLVILLISLLEIFLMLRSSFLSRIKEIGTLRAIGLKKRDIYFMFSGEIIAITVLTSVIGIAAMYYILSHLVDIDDYYKGLFEVNPMVALITFALLLVFNLIVGLIPVFNVMRKTPAQILARTDI